MIELRPYQLEINQSVKNAWKTVNNVLLVLPTGGGKEQPYSEPVLTPTGWTTMGELSVGDYVVNANGSPTSVTDVYEQGVKDVYQITFRDGSTTRCGLDHLWNVSHPDWEYKEKTLPLSYILKKYKKPIKKNYRNSGCSKRLTIQLCKPIEFSEKKLLIHPYALGLLIGDGSFRYCNIRFTDYGGSEALLLSELLPDGDVLSKQGCGKEYIIKGNNTKNSLKHYDLYGKLSIEKHIPEVYLRSSIPQRKALLNGLLDTDGYWKTPNLNEYSTSSPQLANDIIDLARGLGYSVSITKRISKWTYNGEKKIGRYNYRIYISFKSTKKTIWDIKKVGVENSRCIKVNNKNQLYITRDYTVTHNTVCMSDLIHHVNGPVCAIAHRQELVSQISLALARNDIHHKIIGPPNVIKLIVRVHMMVLGKSYYNSQSPVAVAGVDTLIRRHDQLARWLPTVKLWVTDECFPAGTLVDGKPIETLKVGDYVTTFDDSSGEFSKQPVICVFKNPQPKLMIKLVTSSHHVLVSTKGHPFWTKRGWVDACELTVDDEVLIYGQNEIQRPTLFSLWDNYKWSRHNRRATLQIQKKQFNFLQQNVRLCSQRQQQDSQTKTRQEQVSQLQTMRQGIYNYLLKILFGWVSFNQSITNHGSYQSQICFRTNGQEQSYVQSKGQKKSIKDTEKNKTQTKSKGWKWNWTNRSRKAIVQFISSIWVQITNNYKNRQTSWLSQSLQNRLWSFNFENCNRSGWFKPWLIRKEKTRRKENCISYWTRLESIQVYKSSDNRSSSTGFVYNIEVDKYHTYTANGIVVHNCHHLLRENKWGTAVKMFPNAKGLGVTATPMRADGQGLGRHASGVMDKMIVGPTGRELINDGFLTDYRIFAPVSNLDMSKARISKATGDFNQHDAAHAVQESSLITHGQSTRVGDVVNHYLKITPGKLGITFVPDMETGRQIEEQFNFAGVPAKLVNAKTPDDIRARTIQEFSRGEYKQLLNVDLFGEGFDLPALEVVSMARPTDSYGLHVQMFGRVLRLMEGKEVGTIIDHVGNVIKFAQRYGLPDAYNDWTLDDRTKGERESNNGIPMKACPECTFMYERFKKACPDCGYIPVPISRSEIKYVEGSLQELDPFILSKLRGEVLSFDEPIEKQIQMYQAGQQAKGVPYIWEKANTKRFANKLKESQSMQLVLRDAMAWWAGYRRYEGLSDDEIHRLFYLKFDVDWLSAMTLPATDANVLINRIGEQI